jgi:CO/xanthine dehydrogenase Mo-binding subunit
VTTGHAIKMAGQSIQQQLFAVAAPMLKTTPDQLSASLGNIYITSTPSQSVTIASVLAASANPISAIGYTDYPSPVTHVIRTTPAAAVDIALDPNTGIIEVLHMYDCSDVGTADSLLVCEAQIEGGACQSVGHQLMWGWAVDQSNGVPMNPSFLYQRPETFLDVPAPANMASIIEQTYDSVGPFGAKGLGEPPYGVVGAAISNAIFNATGVWVKSQPSTPRAVLQALGKSM